MSSINNIPFDINRPQVETNSTRPKNASSPVSHTEPTKAVRQSIKIKERRNSKKERRKQQRVVSKERRFLKQRREQANEQASAKSTSVESSTTKPSSIEPLAGSIIDIEV
jgi:hypothetical protein